MKRLYVRSEFRGQRIGLQLIKRVIGDARSIGYSRLGLDTEPDKMRKAVQLYESHGFCQIPVYNDGPIDGLMYMELVP